MDDSVDSFHCRYKWVTEYVPLNMAGLIENLSNLEKNVTDHFLYTNAVNYLMKEDTQI